ncbi:hypothetical protein GCM10025788_15060 [Serinicoccus chungangensis]
MPHHHGEVLRPGLAGGMQGVTDEGASTDPVQHLGDRALHPGALAGGEDDHGSGVVGRHGTDCTSAPLAPDPALGMMGA